MQARRRVTYVIPPPSTVPPRLQLPQLGVSRKGAIGPLLIPLQSHPDSPVEGSDRQAHPTWRHPRHRLGVASLALDTSTKLTGRSAPEGILYSGGRDGTVMAWDLGVPMKKKESSSSSRIVGRWEMMTGWDDVIDEEAEEDERVLPSDGDVLGDVTMSLQQRRRRASKSSEIPLENQWETDLNAFRPGVHSQFRQSAQSHQDWVNDILLCNHNQTVVSGSSDGYVKAWNPHSSEPSDPSTIGMHNDYVRCLAYCREQNWVASGSFDRSIKLWDLTRSTSPSANPEPLITLTPTNDAPKSSIYAIAADPFGHTIATGSPEKVIRLWDPRSAKRVGKLVGHTDNIRAILISQDSKYLLTGSADASIKLWSLSSQRCLHTFTHHADSVWSLHSSHPSLETFYSGDRAGIVCRVDVEDCLRISEGDCVFLCHDTGDADRPGPEGINKLAVMDDNLLWTATGTSGIRRWRVPQRRTVRAGVPFLPERDGGEQSLSPSPAIESPTRSRIRPTSSGETSRPSTSNGPTTAFNASIQSLNSEHWPATRKEATRHGIPLDSLVKLISPDDQYLLHSSSLISSSITKLQRDPEVATMYSAASVMSVPRTNHYRSSAIPSAFAPHPSGDSTVPAASAALADYEERELAAEGEPLCTTLDDMIPGDRGLVRAIIMNDRMHALTVDTAGEVAVWDVVRCICKGRYLPEDVAAASHAGSTVGGSGRGAGQEVERSPREALEAVRERIEGEAFVSSWCSVETRGGELAINLNERCFDAEVYADEVGYAGDRHFNDESRLNLAKWVLKNLFIGFIREELKMQRAQQESNRSSGSHDGVLPPSLGRFPTNSEPYTSSTHSRSSSLTDSLPPKKLNPRMLSSITISSPTLIPAVPSPISPSARSTPLMAPRIPLFPKDGNLIIPTAAQPLAINTGDGTPTPIPRRERAGTMDGTLNSPAMPTPMPTSSADYFSARTRQPSMQGGVPGSPATDDFSGWGGPSKEPPTPSTPSGLMGRLKGLGRIGTKKANDASSSPVIASSLQETYLAEGAVSLTSEPEKTPIQKMLSTPLAPPPAIEAPLVPLPPNTMIFISEEEFPSYTIIYQGNVASTQYDTQALEDAMPIWLIEYVLFNKLPLMAPQSKISFILLPWNKDPDVEPLPELLNTTQSKLTASRSLRVRKILAHIQEKLEKVAQDSESESIRPPIEQHNASPRAEDIYEVVCNDILVPLGMSLAAVRHYMWKQSTELVMHYRRKQIGVPGQPYTPSLQHLVM